MRKTEGSLLLCTVQALNICKTIQKPFPGADLCGLDDFKKLRTAADWTSSKSSSDWVPLLVGVDWSSDCSYSVQSGGDLFLGEPGI